jgi:hypothetical protein
MNAPSRTRVHTAEPRIVAGLETCASAVVSVARGEWLLSLANGNALNVRARVHDDWLVLEECPRVDSGAPAERTSVESSTHWLWDLLHGNTELAGGAKFALRQNQHAVQVRAEVPLDDEVDIVRRIGQACAGIKPGAARIRGLAAHGDTPMRANAPVPAVDVAALCRATPWPFAVREPHVAAADLQVPGTFRQAVVSTRPDGKIAASVDLSSHPTAASSPVCRAALAHFLLRANGLVRMARAAAAGETPRFEVVFADAPSPAELGHGLAALSVACRIAAREAEVLAQDEVVARAYLTTCEGAPFECPTSTLAQEPPSGDTNPEEWMFAEAVQRTSNDNGADS